jgi:hypothetical protein
MGGLSRYQGFDQAATFSIVIPANAGIHFTPALDSRVRGNDGTGAATARVGRVLEPLR